ncbi:MAG: hypothetical protein SGILL_006259, partial [Bacillariaceae sp.]
IETFHNMADLKVQDPVLAPDVEPTPGDDSPQQKPSQKESTATATATEDTTTKSTIKVLQVKHKTVKDALGNSGEYTGSINVETNFPHGQGEMIYALPREHTEDNNDPDAAASAAAMTLISSHSGSWQQGFWHGHGSQTLRNGDTFTGDLFQSQRKFGEYRWKEQELQNRISKQRCYQGDFDEHGRPHGHGKYIWTTTKAAKDGDDKDKESSNKSVSTYVGMFLHGQRHGHGVFASPTLQYTGDWGQGKYHGYGVLNIPAKKSTYRGQFHHGKRDGRGEEVLDGGTVLHDGLWRQDQPIKQEDGGNEWTTSEDEDGIVNTGQKTSLPASTIFQTPQEILDGEGILGMYKGIVEDSRPSGVGTIVYEKNRHPAGILEYEGFFDQGIRQGYGRASFGNLDTYHGNWSNGVFEGNGEYTFADGRAYKGVFAKGLPHDTKGRFLWPNNDFFEGTFDNSRRKSGRFVFNDGSYYDGEYFSPDGTYGGNGKLVTLMISYEGGFRDGAFHGTGCLRKNCGTVIFDGEWEDGKAVRDDVLIALPAEIVTLPFPPPDDDFGEFADGPKEMSLLTTLKRNISSTPRAPHANDSHRASISETIMGTFGSLIGLSEDKKGACPQEECKAVVDMAVSDAQDNPGRYGSVCYKMYRVLSWRGL